MPPEGLQNIDYTAALYRFRAPDPTVEDHDFFRKAQNRPIVGLHIDPNVFALYPDAPGDPVIFDEDLAANLSLKPDDLNGLTAALIVPPGKGIENAQAVFEYFGWATIEANEDKPVKFSIVTRDLHDPIRIPYDLHFGPSRPEPFFSTFITHPGSNAHEALRRLITDREFIASEAQDAPEPPEMEQANDRPEVLVDTLERGPLALALANAINKIYVEQKPKDRTPWIMDQLPDQLHDWLRPNFDPGPQTSYILHIDAPWGGGKTTFANYVSSLLNPRLHDKRFFDPNREKQDLVEMFDEKTQGETILSRFFEVLRRPDPRGRNLWSENAWIPVWFNAWEHQHVQPPWWDFRHTIRRGYRRHLGWYDWLNEGVAELAWRIFNPSFMTTLYVIAALVAVFLGLYQIPMVSDFLSGLGSTSGQGNVTSTVVSGVIGAGSIGALITAARTGLHNMVLSASSSSDPAKLGVTDPQRRFSQRFVRSINSFRRPVLVIIDDLDRCDAAYVVELLRGLLTIFKSRRVVYVLLGDKAWIEQALEVAYKDMHASHTEKDVTFGARFAEKVIQMSFLLPRVEASAHEKYLRGLIPDQKKKREETTADLADLLSRVDQTAQRNLSVGDSARALDRLRDEADSKDLDENQKNILNRRIASTEIINQTLAKDTEAKTAEGLLDFVGLLPNNPRRVKRINNLVMMYQLSVKQLDAATEDTHIWKRVALWVILMSEYPKLWEMLCAEPKILDALKEVWLKEPEEREAAIKSALSIAKWGVEHAALAKKVAERDELRNCLLARVDANGDLIHDGKLNFDAQNVPLLTKDTIRQLLALTPIA